MGTAVGGGLPVGRTAWLCGLLRLWDFAPPPASKASVEEGGGCNIKKFLVSLKVNIFAAEFQLQSLGGLERAGVSDTADGLQDALPSWVCIDFAICFGHEASWHSPSASWEQFRSPLSRMLLKTSWVVLPARRGARALQRGILLGNEL